MRMLAACCFLVLVTFGPRVSEGHGRLWEPPGRSTMWKRGFNTPQNYNDNELYCGGFSTQWASNGGKCGICGDNWASSPRENEAGGKYATGIIVRNYTEGETIDVDVEVTANHKGWFEFKLCPNNDVKKAPDLSCFDQYILEDASQTKRFFISTLVGHHTFKLILPKGLTCTQCILQWKWNTGNSWGYDQVTGTGCLGCGAQEQFYGCADVAIEPSNGSNKQQTKTTTIKTTQKLTTTTTTTTVPTTTTTIPTTTTTKPTTTTTRPTTTTTKPTTTTIIPTTTTTKPTTTTTRPTTTTKPTTATTKPTTTTTKPTTRPTTTTRKPTTTTAKPTTTTTRPTTTTTKATTTLGNGSQRGAVTCEVTAAYKAVAGMKWWCRVNCLRGFCPRSHCICH